MSDINKFTSKEVLNKVLLDSSGDAVNAFSHTTQEALNAALDATNNRLNVSLAGGTISGDVTITGDLTVSGGGSLSFDEIIEGTQVIDVTSTEALLVRKNGDGGDIFTVDTTNSAVEVGGHLTLPDGSGSGGVLKLGASEDIQIYHDGSNSYLDHLNTGDLKIRSLKHGGDIVFHTEASDGTQSTSALVVDSNGNIGIGVSSGLDHKLTIKTSATGGDWVKGLQSDGGQGFRIGADSGDDAFFELGSAGTSNAVLIQADGDSHFNGGNVTFAGNVSLNSALTLGVSGSTNGKMNTPESMYFNIDSDNSQTDTEFVWGCNRTAESGGTELMRLTEAGDLGIGTNSPDDYYATQLVLNCPDNGGMTFLSGNTAHASGFYFADGTGTSAYRGQMVYDHNNDSFGIWTAATNAMIIDSSQAVAFSGALSKGSGSFKIDHPLESKKDTHHLVHSFVEGPQADNIYRGKATLSSGSVEINLDTVSGMSEGTFVLLNTDIQCFTSNESDWDAVKGSVSGNKLTVSCQNTDSTATVSWLVIGERQDQHMIDTNWTDENGKVIVEPLKD